MKVPSFIPMQKFESSGLPIKVQTIKSLIAEHDHLNETPHTHNYFEMIWIVNGKGRLYVDMQEYAVDNNKVFCLRPNQAHQLKTETEADGFVFSFTESFFTCEHEFDWTCQSILLQLFSECPQIGIQAEMGADMKEIGLKMIKEFENQYPFKVQLLKRYFRIFLIYIGRQLEPNLQGAGQTREMELVKRFIEIIDKDFRERKTVAEYALQLSLTANHLNRIVKRNTGYSAGHYIRQRVVLEAKRLARYSDAGMKDIAYSLGFVDSSHFSRFFKAVSGINFSEFKREGVNIFDTASAV